MLLHICRVCMFLTALLLTRPLVAQESNEEQVMSMVKQLLDKAAKAGDVSLGDLIAKDALITDPGANLASGEEYVKQIQSGAFAIKEYKLREHKVSFFDDVAVVSLLSDMAVDAQGHSSPMSPYRFTMVVRKQSGKWQLIAAHGTPVR